MIPAIIALLFGIFLANFSPAQANHLSCIAPNEVQIETYEVLNCSGASLTPNFNVSQKPPPSGSFTLLAPTAVSSTTNCYIRVVLNDKMRSCTLLAGSASTSTTTTLKAGQSTSVYFNYNQTDLNSCDTSQTTGTSSSSGTCYLPISVTPNTTTVFTPSPSPSPSKTATPTPTPTSTPKSSPTPSPSQNTTYTPTPASSSTSNLTANCTPDKTSIYTGESVNWNSQANGGSGGYQFAWNGSDGLNGQYGQSVGVTYTSAGSKSGAVKVYDNQKNNVSSNCIGSVQVFPLPVIVKPTESSKITGNITIEISAMDGSIVDLNLQPIGGSVGTLYLGRTKVPSGSSQAQFFWESKNTPNGYYALSATIIRSGGSQTTIGPVKLAVDNTSSAVYKAIETDPDSITSTALTVPQNSPVSSATPYTSPSNDEQKITTSKQTTITANDSALSQGGTQNYASPGVTSFNQSGKQISDAELVEYITQQTTQDITFPSEFNPKQVRVEESTKIASVANTKLDNKELALTFSGVSTPNTIITLLIYSNPIVVTIKTDGNGVWTYNLEKPLPAGDHVAYAVVPDSKGLKVRSEVVKFVISPAIAATTDNESLALETPSEDKPLQRFALVTAGIILGAIMLLVTIYRFKRKAPPETTIIEHE